MSLTKETNRDSVISPQTITGLLQEFDVQASEGVGLHFYPLVRLCPSFLLPISVKWIAVYMWSQQRAGNELSQSPPL